MTLPTRFSGSGAPAISAAYEGATYQQEDTNNGNVYVARAGAWVALARIGSTVTFSALTLSGLGLGIAHVSAGGVFSSSLIVNADIAPGAAIAVSKLAVGAANTVLWSDGAANSFTGAPILATSLQVGIGASSWLLRSYTGIGPAAAIYAGGVTPSDSNYVFAADGAGITSINSPTVSADPSVSAITLANGGVTSVVVAKGLIRYSSLQAALLTQLAPLSDLPTFNFTLRSQQGFSTAIGANRTPGNLVLDIPDPTNGGTTFGFTKFSWNNVVKAQFGSTTVAADTGVLYVGTATPIPPETASSNYILLGNGATFATINGPSGGHINFAIGNVNRWAVDDVKLRANGVIPALILHLPASTDTDVFDFTLRSSAPFATSSSGSHSNSGSLVYDIPAARPGGTAGTHKFQFNTTTAFSFDSATQWSLFGRTWTTGAGAPGGTPAEGALYTRTGATVGDLLVGVNGAWVSTTVGGSGGFVPTSLTLTAGAGLTGGGDLSAPRTFDVVAGDATITVAANDIRVGTIQTANIVLGGANQVLWANGTVNSWTGAPILSTSLTIGALPASAGAIRLSNALAIQARNAANSIDITLIATDSSDRVLIGGSASAVRVSILSVGVVHADASGTLSSSTITNADLAGSIAITKLLGGTDGQAMQTIGTTPTWVTYLGDVTGKPNASTVIGLTGTANVVAMHGTAITSDAGLALTISTGTGAPDANMTLQTGAGTAGTGTWVAKISAASFASISPLRIQLKHSLAVALDADTLLFRTSGGANRGVSTTTGFRFGDGTSPTHVVEVNGDAQFILNGSTMLMMREAVSVGHRVLGIFGDASNTDSNLGTGDLVAHWHDCAAIPSVTALPGNGGWLWENAGKFYHKGKYGLVTTVASDGAPAAVLPVFADVRHAQISSGGTTGVDIFDIDFVAVYNSATISFIWRITVQGIDVNDGTTIGFSKVMIGHVFGGNVFLDGQLSDVFPNAGNGGINPLGGGENFGFAVVPFTTRIRATVNGIAGHNWSWWGESHIAVFSG